MQKNKQQTTTDTNATSRTIRRRIGNTTYNVTVHFSKTSRETMNDKILRLVRNDAALGKAAGL